jgi:protein MpaA
MKNAPAPAAAPLLAALLATLSGSASARVAPAPGTYSRVFTPIPFVSPTNFADSVVAGDQTAAAVEALCREVDARFRTFKWTDDACGKVAWKTGLRSRQGRALLYAEFGKGEDVSVILGGVHPDELTPIPIAFRIARWLDEHPEALEPGIRVIVAPLVNPDGFFKAKPTRTNGNGVDVNRNFFTFDWYQKAKALWVEKRGRLAGHFPGYFPNSEVETIFQIQLIDSYRPDKIMSIHAPLGFLDYDGPGDGQPANPTPTQVKAKKLVEAVAKKSRNYRVVDYTFYPGSLGNFAGQERHIPTVTLEFKTTEPAKIDEYWEQFLPGIQQLINYPFKPDPESLTKDGANASPFSSQYLPGKKTI